MSLSAFTQKPDGETVVREQPDEKDDTEDDDDVNADDDDEDDDDDDDDGKDYYENGVSVHRFWMRSFTAAVHLASFRIAVFA